MTLRRITSRDNPGIDQAARLIASSRDRRKLGRCVLEGEHLVTAYVDRFGPPESLIVTEDALGRPSTTSLLDRISGATTLVADAAAWSGLPQVPLSIGMVAIVATPQRQVNAGARFSLLLDGIQDPGNVGSILRSAAAAGVDQVLLSRECAFAWAPKVLRAGQGAHFHVDLVEGIDLVAWARAYRGNFVAAVVEGGESVFSANLKRPLALAIGNEGAGIAPPLAALARQRVTIPMPGKFESINAAAAAAVCLFEAVRCA